MQRKDDTNKTGKTLGNGYKECDLGFRPENIISTSKMYNNAIKYCTLPCKQDHTEPKRSSLLFNKAVRYSIERIEGGCFELLIFFKFYNILKTLFFLIVFFSPFKVHDH